ncbi:MULTISPECIES: SE1561 family protein [Bacillus]|uniref:Uncharacterized protein n=1 Tax=Bacillus smithii 7_3_47FAA TaxID=665952 RepID=G9QN17_9BACI|nr:SE1561 family protein [Bacillus smithii]AKP46114.1 hypothetical protein BSM4216_0780 [Bacillus smithii]EHL76584.1 hypothetical protein HMPREF1015_00934 [Bacillus smithii 7_3_47FAA]MED0659496.1 SE1561 family protein [Bacillus smithii]MED1420253.1 SE1561 family protein [Bacillus smithii]MED1456384.1 SE1561 family protein [Bacillus smithii]
MGKTIYDTNKQLSYLKERLNMFLTVLDSLEPESTDIEDIDRLIQIVEEIEEKYKQFRDR